MALDPTARNDLRWVCEDYTRLVAQATPQWLSAPTVGTRWTNRGLIFHLWFGQRIARAFLPLIGLFSRLPAGAGRGWARLLTACTRPYNWINYLAGAAGGRCVPLRVTERWMRGDTAAILRWADRASSEQLGRGMFVPPGWDPYFQDWMTRADLLAWAPNHYAHHRAQLGPGSSSGSA